MICLDYQTYNARWGLRGMKFQNWQSFSFTLGYLSNIAHYTNVQPAYKNASISIHIEGNNEQGAWEKEGRIHYYGDINVLKAIFVDLYDHSSAGTRNITRRINSNGYILSLIYDFGFEIVTYTGYTTADVFPADPKSIRDCLQNHLLGERMTITQINDCLQWFDKGYEMP